MIRLRFRADVLVGGARPKANVRDKDGNLWIAKFPSNNDELDIGAWEMVVLSSRELDEMSEAFYAE